MPKYYETFDDAHKGDFVLIQDSRNQLGNIKMNSSKKYEANKFYVGSDSIFSRNWGKPTLTKAIEHAKKLLERDNREEVFIVKIVKVIRRQKAPVEIIDVK